jgi:hypothetical protein
MPQQAYLTAIAARDAYEYKLRFQDNAKCREFADSIGKVANHGPFASFLHSKGYCNCETARPRREHINPANGAHLRAGGVHREVASDEIYCGVLSHVIRYLVTRAPGDLVREQQLNQELVNRLVQNGIPHSDILQRYPDRPHKTCSITGCSCVVSAGSLMEADTGGPGDVGYGER